jgi:SAM-dependent methyltransferase
MRRHQARFSLRGIACGGCGHEITLREYLAGRCPGLEGEEAPAGEGASTGTDHDGTTTVPLGVPDKGCHEIDWWVNTWVPTMKSRGYWDQPGILGPDDWVRPTYAEARRQEARGQVLRVVRLAGQSDDFLDGKAVLEIGPGPLGMLEMSGAAEKFAIDPLAAEYRMAGLLLEGDHGVTWFSQGAETIPLPGERVDVVIAFNSLDHVDDIDVVAGEIRRVLRRGGALLLNVELEHEPTPTEPFTITADDVRQRLFPAWAAQYWRVVPPYESENADPQLHHGSKWLRACLLKP